MSLAPSSPAVPSSPTSPPAASAASAPARGDARSGAVDGPIPGLVLALIMRNEGRCISRCLASVEGIVERMIVLDTGSTDDSIDRARAAGAEVHRAPWPDDFSAARNRVLDLAAPYRCALVLDADEWLIDGRAALAAFVAAMPGVAPSAPSPVAPDPAAAAAAATAMATTTATAPIGVIRVDNQFEQDGQPRLAPAWLPRVLGAGVRYTGRIHEQPAGTAPRRRLDVVVGHDGYRPEPMAAKRDRNRRLLEAELAAHPDDGYLHYQLGKDATAHQDWAAAIPPLETALALGPADAPWRHDLVLRLLTALRRSGDREQALTVAGNESPCWEDSPDFHFCVGDLALDCAVARPDLAADTFFPLIEHHWLAALAIGDRPDLAGAVIGHGSFLAAHNLAVFYRLTGRPTEAARYDAIAATRPDPAGTGAGYDARAASR